MTLEAPKLNNLSIEDYLVVEEQAEERYEYHDGEIFAIAGGSLRHSLVSLNFNSEIRFALKKKNKHCRVFNGDAKLHVVSVNKIFHPDGMIVCGEVQLSPRTKHALTNPSIIIEVLSPSTELYDRTDKFYSYQQVPSLEEYVLVSQDKAQVEVFRKTGNKWVIERIIGIAETVSLTSVGIQLNMESIYENVDFDPET
ncbi:MAG: Uma2 family endonuclease [Bacteroidota bacterium]